MKYWSLFGLLLFPATVVALDYSNRSLLYTDAPFPPAEAAAISVLTSINAVEGNPDGTFQNNRSLNRAEFLKIALESHPRILVSKSDQGRCFPDIRTTDWFSPYVCLAFKRGVVAGYPNGRFHPEKQVNYAEALKILGELYDYTAYAAPDAPWYQIYVQAAINHGTILPVNLPYDRFITRGQMARLAAAYRAEHEGEIELYRQAERGEYVTTEAPGPEPEQPVEPTPEPQTSTGTGETTQDQGSDQAVSSGPDQPVIHTPIPEGLLLLGELEPIADFEAHTKDEDDTELRILKVILHKEARSFESVHLYDEHDNHYADLTLDVSDRDDETWIETFAPGESPNHLIGARPTKLVVKAKIKERDNGGFAEERVQVKTVFMMVSKVSDATQSYQIVPKETNYPEHQTVQARPTTVTSVLSGTGQLSAGGKQQLGSFRFDHEALPGVTFRLKHLRFHVKKSENINVLNWYIRGEDPVVIHQCSTEEDNAIENITVNCLSLPMSLGILPVLDLHGDVYIPSEQAGQHLQVNLLERGSLSKLGDVRWSDGAADYQWMQGEGEIARGWYFE